MTDQMGMQPFCPSQCPSKRSKVLLTKMTVKVTESLGGFHDHTKNSADFCEIITNSISGGCRISQTGGINLKDGGANLLFWTIFL